MHTPDAECVILAATIQSRGLEMNQIAHASEIIATYRKHGWQLRRVLLTPGSRAEAAGSEEELFQDAQIENAGINALWFSRTSQGNREAWELRLIAENPYALFEAFEMDESEKQREEVRREMESRMREYTGGA
jgi:hypothetical protein